VLVTSAETEQDCIKELSVARAGSLEFFSSSDEQCWKPDSCMCKLIARYEKLFSVFRTTQMICAQLSNC